MSENNKKLLNIAVSTHKKYQKNLPDKKKCVLLLDDILGLLFPHFSNKFLSKKEAEAKIKTIEKLLVNILRPLRL